MYIAEKVEKIESANFVTHHLLRVVHCLLSADYNFEKVGLRNAAGRAEQRPAWLGVQHRSERAADA